MDLSILTIARTLPRQVLGGMEEASWNLARCLAKQGVQETILTTSFSGKTSTRQEDGVHVHEIAYVPRRLQNKSTYRWWRYFGRAAAEYAREHGETPDIIHTQSLYADGFLRWHRRPPIVATLHGTPRGDYIGGARDKLLNEVGILHPRAFLQYLAMIESTQLSRRQLRRVDAIVPVSRNVAEALPGVRPGDPRVFTIPNGIDPRDFPWVDRMEARGSLGLSEDTQVLLYVGRIEESKGVGSLLDVLHELPDASLLVAGTGPYLEAFRARVLADPAGRRVRILGPVRAERPTLYAAADLFCLPSRNEGQPVSLLEAMAMGTPVATTRPWLPDELLPFAAVGTDLPHVVMRGLALSASVDRKALRNLVLERFTWDQVARAYLAVFGTLLRENG